MSNAALFAEVMASKRDIPEATCRLERAGDVWQWVIGRCPHCGGRHIHGGGDLDGDPRRLMGHRAAHCGQGLGYTLREAPGGSHEQDR